MRKIFFIVFFSMSLTYVWAQSDLLSHFSGRQIEKYIHLDFTVHPGVTCSQTEVQRSADSIHFETIGTIPGICGNSDFEMSYSFDDSVPAKNQFNYYRILLGQLGNSPVVRLWYVDYGNEFVLIGSTLYFSNPNHQNLFFSVFNLQGEQLQSIQTNDDVISLGKTLFPDLIYFFQVRNERTVVFTGKVVLR